jgi:hypothetical protein
MLGVGRERFGDVFGVVAEGEHEAILLAAWVRSRRDSVWTAWSH